MKYEEEQETTRQRLKESRENKRQEIELIKLLDEEKEKQEINKRIRKLIFEYHEISGNTQEFSNTERARLETALLDLVKTLSTDDQVWLLEQIYDRFKSTK